MVAAADDSQLDEVNDKNWKRIPLKMSTGSVFVPNDMAETVRVLQLVKHDKLHPESSLPCYASEATCLPETRDSVQPLLLKFSQTT